MERFPLHPRQSFLALSIAVCFGHAMANPVAPQVANGSATFQTTGSTLTVTNTPNAIINWQGFSIGAGETTRFVQQSAQSAVLNRVTGQDPSRILGTLRSNGKVFLLNPNGILFGKDAIIDVAGLVASTLNLSNQDFLAGKALFSGAGGGVLNQGTINAFGGDVYLIGSNVRNEGVIEAKNGQVLLAAGQEVQVLDTGTPYVRVTIKADQGEAVNVGRLLSDGGHVDIYGALVRQQGMVSADAVTVGDGGTVRFFATRSIEVAGDSTTRANGATGGYIEMQAPDTSVAGRVEATGATGKGGDIRILGDTVALAGTASVDASGQTGGGQILVGGDWQGKGNVYRAQTTSVNAGATLRTDARYDGDGGKIVVWSDAYTRFYGAAYAQGGLNGGNGGKIEFSSHRILDFDGKPYVFARNASGRGGDVLFDPMTIVVFDPADNGWMFYTPPASASLLTSVNGASSFASNAGQTTILRPSTLAAVLGGGGNVTLQASDAVQFFSALNVAGAGVGKLTIDAASQIYIDAPITTTGNVDIFFNNPAANAYRVQIAPRMSNTQAVTANNILFKTFQNDSFPGFVGTFDGLGKFTATNNLTLINEEPRAVWRFLNPLQAGGTLEIRYASEFKTSYVDAAVINGNRFVAYLPAQNFLINDIGNGAANAAITGLAQEALPGGGTIFTAALPGAGANHTYFDLLGANLYKLVANTQSVNQGSALPSLTYTLLGTQGLAGLPATWNDSYGVTPTWAALSPTTDLGTIAGVSTVLSGSPTLTTIANTGTGGTYALTLGLGTVTKANAGDQISLTNGSIIVVTPALAAAQGDAIFGNTAAMSNAFYQLTGIDPSALALRNNVERLQAAIKEPPLASVMTAEQRHDFKVEAFKEALTLLEQKPDAIDLPACGAGAGLCIAQPKASEGTATPGTPIRTPAPQYTDVSLPRIERKLAVVIGVNKYRDPAIPSLNTAVFDAEEFGTALNEKMGYEVQVVKNARKADIVNALNALIKNAGENDSVTIYYAGHGFLFDKTGTGYWIPADGTSKDPSNWISNRDIAKFLGNIRAKQVTLISDSCFSGTIGKDKGAVAAPTPDNVNKVLDQRTVTVMSSGGEEPVADAGKGGHSIFAWHLLDTLKDVKRFEPGSSVFAQVSSRVAQDAKQTPQYGGSLAAGHTAGGDFLFETRRIVTR